MNKATPTSPSTATHATTPAGATRPGADAVLQPPGWTIRWSTPADVPAIVGLIQELAAFEQLSHAVQVTPETLAPHLFGRKPAAEALVVESAGRVVGFALFFTNFSTFLAKPGLYLEDLYVQPAHRRGGIGKAVLKRLAALAVQRNCGRFEWSVLDWNHNAIGFYESCGAALLHDWRICRVTGPALEQLAQA